VTARKGSLRSLLAGLFSGVRGCDRETRELFAAYRRAEGGLPEGFGVDGTYEREVVEKASCVHLN